MNRTSGVLVCLAPFSVGALVATVAGCSGEPSSPADEPSGTAAMAYSEGQVHAGQRLFEHALSGTNGRACATCHPATDHFALLPASVTARLAADPGDPLFNRIDADDPNAATPTYGNLQKGLIRVVLPLAANIDVIDVAGNVITSPDRTITVLRGVPSVANVAYTAPYQFDGREATLPAQALGALQAHSQISHAVGNGELDLIAAFETSTYTSSRAQAVGAQVGAGTPVASIPIPEDSMPLTAQEQRGKAVFKTACAGCHGGATTNLITNRPAQDSLFFQLDHAGNIIYVDSPGVGEIPAPNPHPNDNFSAPGYTAITYLGQVGRFPTLYNADVALPRYRLRFYTDATRTVQVTDLPPIPVTASGEPFDPNAAIDPSTGQIITGPDFIPQWWSTDPGRCIISGDPGDYESFDIPQLRGVAHTAPYFHDNSHATLADVVDTYSRFILPGIFPLNLPAVLPPEGPGLPPESIAKQDKIDLLAFLQKL